MYRWFWTTPSAPVRASPVQEATPSTLLRAARRRHSVSWRGARRRRRWLRLWDCGRRGPPATTVSPSGGAPQRAAGETRRLGHPQETGGEEVPEVRLGVTLACGHWPPHASSAAFFFSARVRHPPSPTHGWMLNNATESSKAPRLARINLRATSRCSRTHIRCADAHDKDPANPLGS